MADLRRRALVLAGWTLFVWATRIGNIAGDDALHGSAKALRVAVAVSFTVLGLVVGLAAWRRHPRTGQAVAVLAAWTVVVWIRQSVAIVVDDHSAAFVAVHVVLAIVSIALSVAAVRAARRAGSGSSVAVGSR